MKKLTAVLLTCLIISAAALVSAQARRADANAKEAQRLLMQRRAELLKANISADARMGVDELRAEQRQAAQFKQNQRPEAQVRPGQTAAGQRRFSDSRNRIMGVIPTLFIINFVVILVVALIFYWLVRSSKKTVETPLNLLKKRYVLGEIDEKTFHKMKKEIAD